MRQEIQFKHYTIQLWNASIIIRHFLPMIPFKTRMMINISQILMVEVKASILTYLKNVGKEACYSKSFISVEFHSY